MKGAATRARGAAKPVRNSDPAVRTLAQRVVTAPRADKRSEAGAAFKAWLGEIGRSAAGKALNKLIAASPGVGLLLAGIAAGSPYLFDLMRADPARLVALLNADPDERLAAIIATMQSGVSACKDEAAAMRVLRRARAEASLLNALADIGGAWPLARITGALSAFADAAVGAAVRYGLADATRRKRLKPADRKQPDVGSGHVVLAMGKMGAGELNYSSDIDLIVFYDPAAPAVPADVEAGDLHVRVTRTAVKLLQERTADGYVFRVDLRLRPDPASTQIAISLPAALDYYEHRGQNWERAAMIKARACAGDLVAGETMLAALSPFVWRRYLDFAAVADVHDMKRQIHAYRGHGEIAVEGHNIKLGRGGIREIEFFVQTQQLIAGGRHPELRMRGTLEALAGLADGGWIDGKARDDLTAAYEFLRSVEHRLQMVNDEQTHTLPAEPDELERFARFLGFSGRDAFAEVLLAHLHNVQRHYAKLFEGAPAEVAEQRALRFAESDDDRETLDRLALMGFRRPQEVAAAVRRWLGGGHRALRSEQARENLAALVPLIVDHLARAENPDAAFAAFDRFLGGLHGGGRLISLLRQNTELVGFIALILGLAPRLSDILARHPHVVDAMIDPSFFGALPDETQLTSELARSLKQSQSYEDFLDRIRLFGQEHMFLIGARILSGTASAQQAGELFARLADVLIRALHRAVEEDFARTHGRIRGQETAVLAMGKLGGREMTATSDLDLIVIYDYDTAHPESDGKRPLSGGQYFARLTQRLISALTTQTNYGVLYNVDMRLRPSGRSGPLATQLEGFVSYQEKEAWTWEHLALTRARVVSATDGFAARVEGAVRKVLGRKRDAEVIAGDVAEMRDAIAAEKGDGERWDIKYAAGGLVDIEFIAQYLQLIHAAKMPDILDTSTMRALDKAQRLAVLSVEDAEVLRPAARLYHDLTQILRLCLPGPFDPKTVGQGVLTLLARAADVPDFATLEAHLAETQARVRASFNRILNVTP